MTKTGITKLPIAVPVSKALDIMHKLSVVSRKIGQLDERFKHSVVSEALIQLLSLNESVESTRIEGTQVTFTDMVEEQHDKHPRWEVIEVNNYRHALLNGYEQIKNGYPLTSRLIKQLHTFLMDGARGSIQAPGEYRKIQNFIGPTKKIEDATYIPITADSIEDYMQNLEYFINHHPYDKALSTNHLDPEDYIFDEYSDALVKTAIMHAQFESIHPFLDGNGRLGRIMIVLNLVQSGLISQPIFFVSEELEKERAYYYSLLNGVRGDNPDWGSWILFFLNASERMADQINRKLEAVEKLARSGLAKCSTHSEKAVWIYTFTDPFTTVRKTSEITQLSPNTVRRALNNLVENQLLFTDHDVVRNKKYRNYDLMRILRD
ncbi:Fic family protein [Amphibacillus sediminis]|uniref:Fic family protein n=1 Tax=Amphibacillus sediminis TaxID=360185 RepID=UPI0008350781|nr:Fic family protein [Amphibacillus sediminis]